MAPGDGIDAAKAALGMVGHAMQLAADNAEARAAAQELSKAALTVSRAINNALLPLAAVNFAFEKARVYFSERFETDLAKKMESVPRDQLVDPKASIAGPALQGLAFAHEEADLKEMYLNLLASAMDKRASFRAHPSFVEVIRQLQAEEARLLRGILQHEEGLPVAEIRLQLPVGHGWTTLLRHVANHIDEAGKPTEIPLHAAIVDSWTRLGLVDVTNDKLLTGDDTYSWVESRPEFIRLRSERQTDTATVTYQKGILSPTAYGLEFAHSVGILPDTSNVAH